MPLRARIVIGFVTFCGSALIVAGLFDWRSHDLPRFFWFLGAALAVAGLKLALPGVKGTMSVTFVFALFGASELTLSETLVLCTLVTAVQCLWHLERRPKPIQVVFNVANVALAVTFSTAAFHIAADSPRYIPPAVQLLLAAGVFFVANTIPVALVIAASEGRKLRHIWHECYFWTFPYYLVGAAIAGLMAIANHYVGWQSSILVLPVMYLIYRSYQIYLGRLEAEKKQAEQMAALHLRTIEALALAIEAKDRTTHAHLQRVQVFAVEVAREMKLPAEQIEAIRAAALLHDIGKLAVPEHIISKPGRLTAEEFEKMKIHTVVGSEILDRVQFPYPVVPIVRSHHEKFDGTGYPAGLKGEQIPIGARILSAVDFLDAIASDRQYRRGLSSEEALAACVSESGKSFDPAVVEILERKFTEFEKLVLLPPGESQGIVEGGSKDGTLTAISADLAAHTVLPGSSEPPGDFLESIAAARQEVQTLFELAQDLGNSLSLDETLSVLALRLRRIIPYDSMAVYVRREGVLVPEYVSGDEFRLFSSLEIPVGHGLSGWVADCQLPVLNGNPAVETTYLNDPARVSRLGSALAVPLEGVKGNLGVMTLYRAESDAFTKDHLRVLLAISSKVALSIENALRFRQAENSATTDFLTTLPNARSLFLQLDAELSRARRGKVPVTVLVCDLDGFKQVNDRYGHLEGNRVLRAVAGGLKEACREYDYVARMGGDEFVVILPGLPEEALAPRLAAFREAARKAGVEVCGAEVLGLSIGQSFYPEDGEDAEQLLSEADRRMYKEKQETKHRLAVSRKLWEVDLPASITVQ